MRNDEKRDAMMVAAYVTEWTTEHPDWRMEIHGDEVRVVHKVTGEVVKRVGRGWPAD